MLKPSRPELVAKICDIFSLPPGRESPAYFTREQLLELLAVGQKTVTKLKELEEKIHGTLKGS